MPLIKSQIKRGEGGSHFGSVKRRSYKSTTRQHTYCTTNQSPRHVVNILKSTDMLLTVKQSAISFTADDSRLKALTSVVFMSCTSTMTWSRRDVIVGEEHKRLVFLARPHKRETFDCVTSPHDISRDCYISGWRLRWTRDGLSLHWHRIEFSS